MNSIKTFLFFLIFSLGFQFGESQNPYNLFVPNTAHDAIPIHFDLDQADTVTILLKNRWGVTVGSYFDHEFLPASPYCIILPINPSLPEGVYYFIFQVGNYFHGSQLIKFESLVSVTSTINQAPIQFSPNPTSDLLHIPISGLKTIRIIDINGNLLKETKTRDQIISLSDLNEGVYFVNVYSWDENQVVNQIIFRNYKE